MNKDKIDSSYAAYQNQYFKYFCFAKLKDMNNSEKYFNTEEYKKFVNKNKIDHWFAD